MCSSALTESILELRTIVDLDEILPDAVGRGNTANQDQISQIDES